MSERNYDFDNPVDHPIDLGFVNYVQHPTNPTYVVFRFADSKRAADFEEQLTNNKIWFERANEMKRTIEVTMFAVHKSDYKRVQTINYAVEGRHKRPIIPYKALRYGIILVMLSLVVLASVSYCKAQKRLQEVNKSYTLEDGK